MASNPQWCLSLEEWHGRFGEWIREPTPQALLNANIFFDFRPLAGAAPLAAGLREWLADVIPGNRLFLGMLVANALQAEPPLGVIRAFRTEHDEHPGTLDLKTQGTRLFVDAARALALGFGIEATNTTERLRTAAQRLHMDARESDALAEAFEFLQMLRLRVQRGLLDGEPARHNRLDPYALNELDQRMLRESLRQARSLQKQLAATFGH